MTETPHTPTDEHDPLPADEELVTEPVDEGAEQDEDDEPDPDEDLEDDDR